MIKELLKFKCATNPTDEMIVEQFTDSGNFSIQINSEYTNSNDEQEIFHAVVHLNDVNRLKLAEILAVSVPIAMLLHCPQCGERHIDKGEFATKPHHTHACQECGHVWRPAIVATVGVQFLPGFKDEC